MSGANTSSIELQIFRENLDKFFIPVPNALFRGEAMYACLSARARCALGALLSHSDGYKISKKKLYEYLGLRKEATDAVIKELKDGGFLATTPSHGPRGRFVWVWSVRMFPVGMSVTEAIAMLEFGISAGGAMGGFSTHGEAAPVEAEDVSAGGTMGGFPDHGETDTNRTPDVSAGGTMGGFPDHGETGANRASDVSAGRTMGGFTDVGSPEPGNPTSVKPPPIEGTGFEKEQTPTTPGPVDAEAAADGQAATREEWDPDSSEANPETPDPLAVVVAEVLERKPGWRPADVHAAMTKAIEQGRSAAVVPLAMLAVAELPKAFTPNMLLQNGPWWAITRVPAGATAPDVATAAAPYVAAPYVDNGATPAFVPGPAPHAPGARWCARHGGYHNGGCRLCPTEDREADPLAADEARRIARDRAAAALAGARAAQARKDATAALEAAAAMIHQRTPETEPVHETAEV